MQAILESQPLTPTHPIEPCGINNPVAFELLGVGKKYKLYNSRFDNLLDALGLHWLFPWRENNYQDFWALRGINLKVAKGSKIGIIGRNGSGKTTLLKLLTQNFAPSEGSVSINGTIQALMDAGAGFHPDFTGKENIHSSLSYQGFSNQEIEKAINEIAEFTELGTFLEQPIKTYSAGMLSRLAFATATSVKPEILIIDEILGAGDGYFFQKSSERMARLVDSGATIVIVSHAMEQITRLCDYAIWLDRGKIIEQGNSLEVVKAYEQFLRKLTEQRLKEKNKQSISQNYQSNPNPSKYFVLEFAVKSDTADGCDISEVKLLDAGKLIDTLCIGEPQDTSTGFPCYLKNTSIWSAPKSSDRSYRTLYRDSQEKGELVFNCPHGDQPNNAFVVTYRTNTNVQTELKIWETGKFQLMTLLPPTNNQWKGISVPILTQSPQNKDQTIKPAKTDHPKLRRWPGEGSLVIKSVHILGKDEEEQYIFQCGGELKFKISFVAEKDNFFTVIPAIVIFRNDGVTVSQHIGKPKDINLSVSESSDFILELDPLLLGDGSYIISAALYRELDLNNLKSPKIYDLIDRSFEFIVEGNPPINQAVFNHPGTWRFK